MYIKCEKFLTSVGRRGAFPCLSLSSRLTIAVYLRWRRRIHRRHITSAPPERVGADESLYIPRSSLQWCEEVLPQEPLPTISRLNLNLAIPARLFLLTCVFSRDSFPSPFSSRGDGSSDGEAVSCLFQTRPSPDVHDAGKAGGVGGVGREEMFSRTVQTRFGRLCVVLVHAATPRQLNHPV